MSTSLNTLSLTELLNRRSLIDAEIAKQTGGASVVETDSGKGNGKKEKKPSSRTGKPTAWSAFSSMLQKTHADSIKAFKEANPEVKSAHLKWVGDYKKEHLEEYESFTAKYEAEHPKTTVTEVTEVGSQEGAPEAVDQSAEEVQPKPKRVLSPEHLAKMKAGREAKKAVKDAAKAQELASAVSSGPVSLTVPGTVLAEEAKPLVKKKVLKTAKKAVAETVVEPVAEVITDTTSEPEQPEAEGTELPFKLGGTSYIRIGVANGTEEPRWLSNDLWVSKRGARGPYMGELLEDGTINTDAEEPPVVKEGAWA